MTFEHFNPNTFSNLYVIVAVFHFYCHCFYIVIFFFLDLPIHLPLSWLIMPSFISICTYNTNMYSYIFLYSVISICYLLDQLGDSCLLRELGPEGKHFLKVSSRSSSNLCKVLTHAFIDFPVLEISPHTITVL